jgi:hypothetical protein
MRHPFSDLNGVALNRQHHLRITTVGVGRGRAEDALPLVTRS